VLWCPEKKTSRTELWTLYDIAQAANDSGECNSTELVGYHNGEVLVKVFDWANTFASTFKRIDNLTQYHHFKVNSKEQPGMVKCYKTLESEPIVLNLLKKNAKDLSNLSPSELIPAGFSIDRENYLFNDIREFCKDGTEDLVAPHPSNKKARNQ